jgi:hypothetical protein
VTTDEIDPAIVVAAREGFHARFHLTPADEIFDALARSGHLTLKAFVELAQRYEG